MIVNINIVLVEEVLQILEKAEAMFDILEYSYIPTLQSVKLRNRWSEVLTTDSAAGRTLKRKLVLTLDRIMWVDITVFMLEHLILIHP